ncbi:gamma-glutamyltransferase [Cryptococcus amylolentus CBS 6273]|uniref:Glutathione hydrolase n=1 Tax=Cryptococcus amylolentus CBS 6273 TaxID=1296118 RepID=A0A1E3KFT4_9TREE|nr:gamma-glutamyltransferase [Cryptococcus amylolentus CBS 6273]
MPSGAVVSEHSHASTIGTRILAAGGSAVDALIATTIAVNTLNPYHSDLGGGGFAVLKEASPEGAVKLDLTDFALALKAAVTAKLFKKLPAQATAVGGLAVAVPGQMRGFAELHERYGVLSWKQLFQESIDLAQNGFALGGDLYEYTLREANPPNSTNLRDTWLDKDPSYASLIQPDGHIIPQGSIWKRPELAKALRKIAEEGAEAFYEGEIAEALVKAVRDRDGLMTVDDLKNYKPIWREALSTKYKGFTLYAPPAPASGAIWLSAMSMLSRFEPEGYGTVTDLHRLTEALRLAYGQRTALGDPAFVDDAEENQKEWLTEEYIERRKGMIDDKETKDPDYYKPAKVEIVTDAGTSNITTTDSSGLTISVTTTVGLSYGSHIMVPGWGFVLNDSMDDFSVEGRPNQFGYEPQVTNYVAGGKRPLSSSCPYIITHPSGRVHASGGAAGGSTIISSNTQIALSLLAYNHSAAQALSNPRLHNQILPNVSTVERGSNVRGVEVKGFTEEQVEGLRKKGHKVQWVEKAFSTPCAILWTGDGWEAEGDPRKHDSGGSVYIEG